MSDALSTVHRTGSPAQLYADYDVEDDHHHPTTEQDSNFESLPPPPESCCPQAIKSLLQFVVGTGVHGGIGAGSAALVTLASNAAPLLGTVSPLTGLVYGSVEYAVSKVTDFFFQDMKDWNGCAEGGFMFGVVSVMQFAIPKAAAIAACLATGLGLTLWQAVALVATKVVLPYVCGLGAMFAMLAMDKIFKHTDMFRDLEVFNAVEEDTSLRQMGNAILGRLHRCFACDDSGRDRGDL